MKRTVSTHGYYLIVAVALIAGCDRETEHNPAFVGKWRSGLPVSAGFVPDSLSNAKQMNARAQESVREKNASGEQGVELDIRPDGTFTMRVWMDIDTGLFDYVDPDNPAVQEVEPRQEHTVDGTWESEGREIHLTFESGILALQLHEENTRDAVRRKDRRGRRFHAVFPVPASGTSLERPP